MIIFIIILIFLSFLQSTILSANFVFLAIITRSFITDEKENFYLAFFFGLLLSLLLGYPLGFLSLTYLLSVLAVKLIKKVEFSTSWISVLPVSIVLLLFDLGARSLFLKSSFNLLSSLPEIILVVPIYLLIRFWEERFIIKHEIRLKVGK